MSLCLLWREQANRREQQARLITYEVGVKTFDSDDYSVADPPDGPRLYVTNNSDEAVFAVTVQPEPHHRQRDPRAPPPLMYVISGGNPSLRVVLEEHEEPAVVDRLRRGARVAGAAVASLLMVAAGCSGADAPEVPASDWRYPGAAWDRVGPAEAGLDPAALDELAAEADAAGSQCLVVTRDGAVVDERYWRGGGEDVPREAFSVTKSVTSTLVGITQDEGLLEITDPAADYIDAWRGTASQDVTIENLLRNDSGRHWDATTDYGQMALGAADKTAFAVGLGQDAPPGELWAYNNAAIQTLEAVLEEATGQAPRAFAASRLFDPIGMADTTMTTDQAGNTTMFMGLRTTCLDLARLGYLMLRDGQWDGEQVVPPDYVEQATGRSSTDLNDAYGLLWWLNRPGTVVSPLVATTGDRGDTAADHQMAPGAPEDVFWALGFNNQIVTVIPSEGIVAVRMGSRPPADAPFTQVELTTALLDALQGGTRPA